MNQLTTPRQGTETRETPLKESSQKNPTRHAVRVARDIRNDLLESSQQSVRQRPLIFVAGAWAIGVGLGVLLRSFRHEPTFRERYIEDPMENMKKRVLAALEPMGEKLHDGYDVAHRLAAKTAAKFREGQSKLASLKFW